MLSVRIIPMMQLAVNIRGASLIELSRMVALEYTNLRTLDYTAANILSIIHVVVSRPNNL